MNPKIDLITIGVEDLERARTFYEQGFGCMIEDGPGELLVSLGTAASRLALRPWEAVAADAGVPSQTSGFRGFTLSYIVDSADGVDDLLARVSRNGGEISKPPRNALWGYSAYVTDPSGYLWKIASSKRRPLIARTGSSTSANGHARGASQAQEVPITIGVADVKRAKEFYKDGLGLPVKKDYRKFVMFRGADGTSDLGMYRWEALADDAAVPPSGSGFRGLHLTHLVDSTDRVDGLLNQAARSGGRIVKAPLTGGDEYSGYFTDPDGYLWKLGTRN
jgi:catechol 2,3-dioxygenase-like lactoylglutathione lyase family enzyme